MNKIALEYAQEKFKQDIRDLLDDPSDLLHPGRQEDPKDFFKQMRKLADALELDYDGVIACHRPGFERERLAKIESGEITPAIPLDPDYWTRQPAGVPKQPDRCNRGGG